MNVCSYIYTHYNSIIYILPPSPYSPDPLMEYASTLCLHLLKAALPFIKPARSTPNKEHPELNSDLNSIPSAVLSHLCGILDSSETDALVRGIAQEIVVEGVVIFFPDAKTRKEYLLNMIKSVVCVCVMCVRVMLCVGVCVSVM